MTKLTLGIDEVGRGAWAGPLVVGAVALGPDCQIDGLNDSKKLTRRQRELLTRQIQTEATAIGIGWVDAQVIDKIGLSAALRLATERAFAQISPYQKQIDSIIIDGRDQLLDDARVTTMIKADGKIKAVSAASIIAKVARDHYMEHLNLALPSYDFASHVGYGTSKHQTELVQHGAIHGIHRYSFAPIAAIAGTPKPPTGSKVINTIGRQAEIIAAAHLERLGHRIIDQNWRTKLCEIDIISVRNHSLYFTEVKYRHNATHGDGLAAITPTKVDQMKFATKLFLAQHNHEFQDYDIILSAISATGNPPIVQDYVENIFDYS
ncbi:MAG: ribonuclease HII [Sphaerimonospora mesophila]